MPLTSLTFSSTAPHFRAPRAKIEQGLRLVFEKSRKNVGISLVFVPEGEIIRLHAKFLHLRTTTDVLTFVVEETVRNLEVEIFICIDTARRQAKQNRVTVRNELIRLSVHGALHSAGYDDHETRDRSRMWKRQEKIVALVEA
jgi:probable rRNA maturation factor